MAAHRAEILALRRHTTPCMHTCTSSFVRILCMGLAFGTAGLIAEESHVQLKLDRGATPAGQWSPYGVGVPLKEGMLKDAQQVGIVSRTRGALPVQCEARTRYPDGSVQWLWADFQGPAEDGYDLVVNTTPRALPKGLQVVNGKDKVSVMNGIMNFVWDTRFATPVRIDSLPPNGTATTLAAGNGAGGLPHR